MENGRCCAFAPLALVTQRSPKPNLREEGKTTARMSPSCSHLLSEAASWNVSRFSDLGPSRTAPWAFATPSPQDLSPGLIQTVRLFSAPSGINHVNQYSEPEDS